MESGTEFYEELSGKGRVGEDRAVAERARAMALRTRLMLRLFELPAWRAFRAGLRAAKARVWEAARRAPKLSSASRRAVNSSTGRLAPLQGSNLRVAQDEVVGGFGISLSRRCPRARILVQVRSLLLLRLRRQ